MQAAKKVATVLNNKALSPAQALTLMAVAELPGSSTAEIAKKLKANPARTSERLLVLAAGTKRTAGRKLIKGTAVGRAHTYALTATGKRVVEQLKKAG